MEIETINEDGDLDDEIIQHQTHIVHLNEDVVHGDDRNMIEALDTMSEEDEKEWKQGGSDRC